MTPRLGTAATVSRNTGRAWAVVASSDNRIGRYPISSTLTFRWRLSGRQASARPCRAGARALTVPDGTVRSSVAAAGRSHARRLEPVVLRLRPVLDSWSPTTSTLSPGSIIRTSSRTATAGPTVASPRPIMTSVSATVWPQRTRAARRASRQLMRTVGCPPRWSRCGSGAGPPGPRRGRRRRPPSGRLSGSIQASIAWVSQVSLCHAARSWASAACNRSAQRSSVCSASFSLQPTSARRMLTAAGADEALAVAVVDIAQSAAADHGRELVTQADLAAHRPRSAPT